MTLDQLTQIGQVLYGTQWQSDMARALGIDSRRIRQWLADERPLPDWLDGELKTLLSDNIAQATALLHYVKGLD